MMTTAQKVKMIVSDMEAMGVSQDIINQVKGIGYEWTRSVAHENAVIEKLKEIAGVKERDLEFFFPIFAKGDEKAFTVWDEAFPED